MSVCTEAGCCGLLIRIVVVCVGAWIDSFQTETLNPVTSHGSLGEVHVQVDATVCQTTVQAQPWAGWENIPGCLASWLMCQAGVKMQNERTRRDQTERKCIKMRKSQQESEAKFCKITHMFDMFTSKRQNILIGPSSACHNIAAPLLSWVFVL